MGQRHVLICLRKLSSHGMHPLQSIQKLCYLFLLLLLPVIVLSQIPGSFPVSLPEVTGPIPVSATSYSQLAANRSQTPVDLVQAAYVEEEFFVSGQANVYDWALDGSLSVSTANAPYTTRILVRRPSSASAFSGKVIVETVNNARRYDWTFIWALSYQQFLDNGDVYVAVTHTPEGLEALRAFDPVRYGSLSFANPNPEQTCGPQNFSSEAEEGLRWDMISQVGALLKSGSGPLADFDVQALYASTHTRELTTYANSVHQRAKLANGQPVYDGFVIKSEYAPVDRISRCAPAPGEGDPRRIVRNSPVPVIRVTAQGDVMDTIAVRREDSDDSADLYRLWEVAGAPHMDKLYYDHMPVPEDQSKTGQVAFLANWPMAYACAPDIDLLDFPIMRYTVNAAFVAIDQWARNGIPAPRATRIGLVNEGTEATIISNDENGNAVGGVRSAYLDVPAATYFVHSQGPAVCNNLGRKVPFTWATLEALYGNSDNYARQVMESLDGLVSEGWITQADSESIQIELLSQ